MTASTGSALLCLAIGGLAATPIVFAQDRAGRPASSSSSAEATMVAPQAPMGTTPAPSMAMGGQSRRETAVVPQGFSVVLVLGDLQASTASDDVPLAARKALTDMKDFLPFKSYRLLDAAWLLCCGQEARTGVASTRGVLNGREMSGAVSQLLRGPDDREYELKLSTSRGEGSRVYVRFSLTNPAAGLADVDADSGAATPRTRDHERTTLGARKASLERQLEAKRSAGQTKTSDYQQLQSELESVVQRIQALTARSARPASPLATTGQSLAARAVIDTSFTMDVGETVVVGTSRLRGGSKALIALLTAVPPRSGRRE